MEFTISCFINNKEKITKFIPEVDVKEIEVTEEIFKKHFPKHNLIDRKRLRLTNIGIYSIALPKMAVNIADIIARDNGINICITDALSNMGGMTITFAQYFHKVVACEIVPLHCEILKNNLSVYGIDESKVELICGDYMDHMMKIKQDVIFFDPPWGGVNYKNQKYISLGINNVNISCIINKLMMTTKFIYMLVPPNYNPEDILAIHHTVTIFRLDAREKSKMLLRIVR